MAGAYDYIDARLPYWSTRFVRMYRLDAITETRRYPCIVYNPDAVDLGTAANKAEYMALWNADQVGKHKLVGWHAPFGFYMISYIAPAFDRIIGEDDESETGEATGWITEEGEEIIVEGGGGEQIINE